MVKVKSNINCCEDGVPTRSLRSRKRNSNHETLQTVEATKHPQDTEENDGVVAVSQQFPLPECFVVIDQQDQAVKQSGLTKHLPAEEKHTEAVNEATDETSEAVQKQKETTATNPNCDSQPKVSDDHTGGDELTNGKDMEVAAVEEDPARTDHLQIVQIAEEVNGSCEAASQEPPCATANHQSHSEENEDASCSQTSDSCPSEITETLKEPTVGVPPKKKRRMGMCVLTEKERSDFLLAQNRDNGTVSAEKQMSEKPAESLPSPCLPSLIPPIPEETQSSNCGDLNRSETDVHVAVATSETSDPEGKICEAEPATVGSSEEIHQPKPGQVVKQDKHEEEEEEEEEEGEPLASQRLQESKQSLTESEIGEKQVKAAEAGNSMGCCDSDATDHTSSEEERRGRDAVEETVPPTDDETQPEGEEEMPADAVCSASADTREGDTNCGSVDISEAAATPNVSEATDQSDHPVTGPAAANAERTLTSDPFESTCSDYVSDSQLNNIDLRLEKEKESSSRHEDGTNLICGLIRELSSLNRKVMAAHRELEVFHRRGKSSRNFL